jgi:Cupin
VSVGQATVFPQDATHFEQNFNCDPIVFVAGFNSDDPSVQTVASSFVLVYLLILLKLVLVD